MSKADDWGTPYAGETQDFSREAEYRSALWNDDRVSRNAAATGSALIRRYWKRKELFASQGTIAKVAKYAPTYREAVRRDLRELVALGYLVFLGKYSGGVLHFRFTIPVGVDTSDPDDLDDGPVVPSPVPAPQEAPRLPVPETPESPAAEGGRPVPAPQVPSRSPKPANPFTDARPDVPAWHDEPWTPPKAEPIVPRPQKMTERRVFNVDHDEPPF